LEDVDIPDGHGPSECATNLSDICSTYQDLQEDKDQQDKNSSSLYPSKASSADNLEVVDLCISLSEICITSQDLQGDEAQQAKNYTHQFSSNSSLEDNVEVADFRDGHGLSKCATSLRSQDLQEGEAKQAEHSSHQVACPSKCATSSSDIYTSQDLQRDEAQQDLQITICHFGDDCHVFQNHNGGLKYLGHGDEAVTPYMTQGTTMIEQVG